MSFKQVVLGNTQGQVRDYLYGEQLDLLPAFAVRDERYKLIEDLRDGNIKCFDNLTDPGEKDNICSEIPEKTDALKRALDLHTQTVIREAMSYSDWENNLALAIITQRDSKGLVELAPREAVVGPGSGNSEFQLNKRGLWSALNNENCAEGVPAVASVRREAGICYWAPPGRGEASAIWRTEMPLTGEYEIYVRYGGAPQATPRVATNANLTVRFKGGSLGFSIDQNQNQGRWNLLGRFDHPISVTLTNAADGPVVAGAVRFLRIEEK